MNINFDFKTTTIVKDDEVIHRLELADCSTFEQLLRRIVSEELRATLPDQIITATQAKKMLGSKNLSDITRLIERGTLQNYATGDQRPKLSLKQVTEYKLKRA